MTETDLLRAARRFPVKAKVIISSLERLSRTPLPALAMMRDGGVMVVGKLADDGVFCQCMNDERPLIRRGRNLPKTGRGV